MIGASALTSCLGNHRLGTVSWVFTAYLISGAAVTIVICRVADIYGAKKMLLLVFLCYIVGTILGGFAQNIYTLLVFRTIRGMSCSSSSSMYTNCTRSVSKGEIPIRSRSFTIYVSGRKRTPTGKIN